MKVSSQAQQFGHPLKTNVALRMAPGTPIWEREAVRDTFLPIGGGPDGQSPLFVPKGQMVQYIFYALCHDDHQWNDAEAFRPERWERLKYSWDYTPFGGGSRICPGRRSFTSRL